MSEEDYRNEFVLLEQDKKGNVSFDVLTKYLTSMFDLSDVAVLKMIHNTYRRKQKIISFRQFINLMRKLQTKKTPRAKKSKEIFDFYDLGNNGYI